MAKVYSTCSCGAVYFFPPIGLAGRHVTAVDSSDRLVGIAREINDRERFHIQYAVAEPTDLSVIEDSMFDDIVCNYGHHEHQRPGRDSRGA